MKTLIILATLITLSSSAFWLVAPEYQKEKVRAVLQADDLARQCLNVWKQQMTDPESAILIGSMISTVTIGQKHTFEEEIISVEYRAKNKLGGYVVNHVECPTRIKDKPLDKAEFEVRTLKLLRN